MMPGIPNPHAIAALVVTIAMFIGFARGRLSVEIVSLLTIAVIAVGLYSVSYTHLTLPTKA